MQFLLSVINQCHVKIICEIISYCLSWRAPLGFSQSAGFFSSNLLYVCHLPNSSACWCFFFFFNDSDFHSVFMLHMHAVWFLILPVGVEGCVCVCVVLCQSLEPLLATVLPEYQATVFLPFWRIGHRAALPGRVDAQMAWRPRLWKVWRADGLDSNTSALESVQSCGPVNTEIEDIRAKSLSKPPYFIFPNLIYIHIYFWHFCLYWDYWQEAKWEGDGIGKDHKPELGSPEAKPRYTLERCPRGYQLWHIAFFIKIFLSTTISLYTVIVELGFFQIRN